MDKQTFTLDRFTRGILTAITALLTVIAVELWVGRPDTAPPAYAQIPDGGMQRSQLITETQKTNELLGRILVHLETKPVKVKVESAEKAGGGRGKDRGK